MTERTQQDDTRLPDEEVRAMVRLLGEVAAVDGGHEEKKRALMNGLCGLVEADFWVWALATSFELGQQLVYTECGVV